MAHKEDLRQSRAPKHLIKLFAHMYALFSFYDSEMDKQLTIKLLKIKHMTYFYHRSITIYRTQYAIAFSFENTFLWSCMTSYIEECSGPSKDKCHDPHT